MIGHSLGVQVALETVLLFPEQVGSLVLINGCHGHAFNTAFQPIVRIPLVSDLTLALVQFLQSRPAVFRGLHRLSSPFLQYLFLPAYVRLFGSRKLEAILGPNYLFTFWENYMAGLLDDSPHNFEHWVHTFQEIDAHSVYHLLHLIEQPTLLLSGWWDMLLPPLVSEQIASRMPHSIHKCDPWSTHATVLESPEWTLHQVWRFLHAMPTAEADPHAETQAEKANETSANRGGAAKLTDAPLDPLDSQFEKQWSDTEKASESWNPKKKKAQVRQQAITGDDEGEEEEPTKKNLTIPPSICKLDDIHNITVQLNTSPQGIIGTSIEVSTSLPAAAAAAAIAPVESGLASAQAAAQGKQMSAEEKTEDWILCDTSKACAVRKVKEDERGRETGFVGGDPFEGL